MPVRIATDCSGMEAPIQALRALKVPHKHLFSCDIDKHARATIAANFPHGVMYEDVTQRDNAAAPRADVYVAGFPCQPFSCAGLGEGFKDSKGRGKIFFYVLDYIREQRPKIFILENVSGLVNKNKGTYFAAILKCLDNLGEYNVAHRVLNTKEHGVPQNRKRIYIVGIRKDCDKGSFAWPEPIECPSIERFLDARRPRAIRGALPPKSQGTARGNVQTFLRKLRRSGSDPEKEPFLLDCDSTAKRAKAMYGITPCITVGRKHGHWVTNRGRRLLKTEMFRLHGMDPTQFKVVISDAQLGKQLGNTMSVNVLERVLVRLLPAAGLVKKGSVKDRWESGEALRSLKRTIGGTFRAGEAAGLRRRLAGAAAVAAGPAKRRRGA